MIALIKIHSIQWQPEITIIDHDQMCCGPLAFFSGKTNDVRGMALDTDLHCLLVVCLLMEGIAWILMIFA